MEKKVFLVFVIVLISYCGFQNTLLSQNPMLCGLDSWISKLMNNLKVFENSSSLDSSSKVH